MRPMLRCALLALLAPWISLTAAAAAAVEPSSVLYTVFPAPVRTERHLDRVEAIMDTWGAGQRVVVVSGESGQQQPVHGAPVWHVPDVTGKISEASMRIYLQRAMQEKCAPSPCPPLCAPHACGTRGRLAAGPRG